MLPRPVPTVKWSSEDNWEANLAILQGLWTDANEAVNELRGTQGHIIVDELAILLPKGVLSAFIDDALQHGWWYFNNSIDSVWVEPFGTSYSVQYHFLRHKDHLWRIEAMVKGEGISPLHGTLESLTSNGFPVVHASYKPKGGEHPSHYAAEQEGLRANGYMLAQECRSNYGRFGYWRNLNSPISFYLKPRINTRDSGGDRRPPLRMPQQVLAEAGLAPEKKQAWQTEGEFAS